MIGFGEWLGKGLGERLHKMLRLCERMSKSYGVKED